ncbi:MAG: hypothetical protein J0H96_05790 [Microbacterium ginsengisoli]|nr:hypothetical protein [Microbacterium ginsengisoli]
MNEQEIRDALERIDEKRKRAKTLADIARWPMGVPSEMRSDKKRGWFASIWRGHGETVMGEVVLTREERRELVDWMEARALRLYNEANVIAATLNRS